jgi:NAD(P)H-dependent FMN reductase
MCNVSPPLKITILSCSLDPKSRSRVLARQAEHLLQAREHVPHFIDLQDFSLPEFDNSDCYRHPAYFRLHEAR